MRANWLIKNLASRMVCRNDLEWSTGGLGHEAKVLYKLSSLHQSYSPGLDAAYHFHCSILQSDASEDINLSVENPVRVRLSPPLDVIHVESGL